MRTPEFEIYNQASASLESRRIPDPYDYVFDENGELVSVYTGEPVPVETETCLGRSEAIGLRKLKRWFRENSHGEIFWLSPAYPDSDYKVPKGIVSRIVFKDGRKRLANIAIVLDDLSPEDCLRYANDLGSIWDCLEAVRADPIPLNGTSWLGQLKKYIDAARIEEMLSSGYHLKAKEEAIVYPVYGQMPLRCIGRTGFRAIFENSFFLGPTFECPRCKGDIPSGWGITVCPNCGARKEDHAVCI